MNDFYHNSGQTIKSYIDKVMAGEADPLDWWRSCADRIEKCEPDIQAWESLASETPEPDAYQSDNLLYGVPVGIKDIIDTTRYPTGWGTKGYLQSPSALVDAALVTMLKEQGALIMGKTVSTEFAYLTPGKTRNPRDISRTPGGSSSGSAAAVAAGMVPLAFGTQTAGSIIRPASYCGVFGFKPTFNTLSVAGVKSFSSSLDTLGWFANNIQDICTAYSALTRAPQITGSKDLTGVRVGVHSLPNDRIAGDDVERALSEAILRFKDAGAQIVPVVVDDRFEALVEHQKTVMAYEAAQSLASEHSLFTEQMGPELVDLINEGKAIEFERYRDALLAMANAQQELNDIFANQVNIILAASTIGEAPNGLGVTGDPLYCRAWTLLGVPCINLPLSSGSANLPVGVQAIANRWQDQQLLEHVQTLMSYPG